MSRALQAYPDIRRALILLIERSFDELTPEGPQSWHVGPKWIPKIHEHLPFVRVGDVGGNDDGLTDVALEDVDVLHRTQDEADDLARRIQALLLGYPHIVGSTVIDKARTAMRPHDAPWNDDRVSRNYSSYQISARR